MSRATLHNADYVRKKDLREGDRVRVARAGDVIPEVVERVERDNKYARKFRMPDSCPSCGTDLEREGAYLYCPAGLSCRAQLRGRIVHFASRQALDIEHLGEKTAAQLVERGLVSSLADLFRLEPADIAALEGFAAKSARQLHGAIGRARTPRLDRFLHALSIRHVGQDMAGMLARHFGTLDGLVQAKRQDLEAIDGVGPQTARSVTSFFAENKEVVEDLKTVGVRVGAMAGGQKESPLAGKTFVFTGALDRFTRSEAERAVEDLGASATSGVSGNTDYLVVGDEPGQKLEQAKDQEAQILREDDFLRLLESHHRREAAKK